MITSEELLSALNDSQRKAVEFCDASSLVIAGAGSGKTRVLTYKIAYLLNQGYEPWSILALTFTNKAANKVQYSTNGSTWTDIAANSVGNVTLANAGDKVYFQGSNVSYYPGDNPSKISFDKACYVYGDIMTLAKDVSLGDFAFMKLFEGETDLRSHPTKRLALTATTLPKQCYESMFSGCTGMLKGPEFATPSTSSSTLNLFSTISNSVMFLKVTYISMTLTT